MRKYYWTVSILLIATPLIANVARWLPAVANSEKQLSVLESNNNGKLRQKQDIPEESLPARQPGGRRLRPPPGTLPARRPGGVRWRDVVTQLSQERPVGVRGTTICAIAPAPQLRGTRNAIWHNRPLFIWQGTAQRIELRASGSQQILWSKILAANDRTATYDGVALQPGQRYEWRLYVLPRDFVGRLFRVMETSERNPITAELTALENQLKAQGVSAETIASERSYYFAKKRLWSDSLQEMYGLSNPSEDLTQVAQEITSYICGSAN